MVYVGLWTLGIRLKRCDTLAFPFIWYTFAFSSGDVHESLSNLLTHVLSTVCLFLFCVCACSFCFYVFVCVHFEVGEKKNSLAHLFSPASRIYEPPKSRNNLIHIKGQKSKREIIAKSMVEGKKSKLTLTIDGRKCEREKNIKDIELHSTHINTLKKELA